MVCDDSRFLPKLRSSCVIDTHARAIPVKLNATKQMKHYSIADRRFWLQLKRGLRLLYASASRGTEGLHKVHDHALAEQRRVNVTVKTPLGPSGGLECGQQQRTVRLLTHTASG